MLIIFETTKQHTLQNIRCMCVGHRFQLQHFLHQRCALVPLPNLRKSSNFPKPLASQQLAGRAQHHHAPPQQLKGHSGLKVTRLGRDGKAKKIEP